jgi:hypothetical protein
MKTKTLKLTFILMLFGLFASLFTNEARSGNSDMFIKDDPYLYLYCEETEVTNGEIQFEGTTPLAPYVDGVDIVVSNGYWDIRYRTYNDEEHIGLSEDSGSSDATVGIFPDGTPGTYHLDFYLDNDFMASLTIEVE